LVEETPGTARGAGRIVATEVNDRGLRLRPVEGEILRLRVLIANERRDRLDGSGNGFHECKL